MPRIGEVQRSGREALEIPGLPWLQEALHGGLVRGGIYLGRDARATSDGRLFTFMSHTRERGGG
jgi:hypothetical protein